MTQASLRYWSKQLLPPIFLDGARWARSRIMPRPEPIVEWEYVPEGWARQRTDARIKGWNVESVLEAYKSRWDSFVRAMQGTGPLGVAHESPEISQNDYAAHNTLMAFAYVFALAARGGDSLTMLDWGGGIGHYYLIAQAVVPGCQIEYACKDVPTLATYGQTLLPEARFFSDDTCFDFQYDFVLASGSLQYSEDWKQDLTKLAHAARRYLFVTRLPVVFRTNSFVVVQRPYQYGYDTEYLGWYFNRQEFLDCATASGVRLVREFLIEERPHVQGAPEQGEYRGFLFEQTQAYTA